MSSLSPPPPPTSPEIMMEALLRDVAEILELPERDRAGDRQESRKVTPAIPASPEIAPKLSKLLPGKLLREPRFGHSGKSERICRLLCRILAKSSHLVTSFSQFGAKFGPIWAQVGRHLAHAGRLGPNSCPDVE